MSLLWSFREYEQRCLSKLRFAPWGFQIFIEGVLDEDIEWLRAARVKCMRRPVGFEVVQLDDALPTPDEEF